MENMALENERDHHPRMVLEENEGDRDDEKYFLHDKTWYV